MRVIPLLPRSSAPSYDGDRERRANLVAGKVHSLQGHPDLALPFLRRLLPITNACFVVSQCDELRCMSVLFVLSFYRYRAASA